MTSSQVDVQPTLDQVTAKQTVSPESNPQIKKSEFDSLNKLVNNLIIPNHCQSLKRSIKREHLLQLRGMIPYLPDQQGKNVMYCYSFVM